MDDTLGQVCTTVMGRCKQVLYVASLVLCSMLAITILHNTGIGAHIVNYVAHPYISPIELASGILHKLHILRHYRGLCAQFCFDRIVNTFGSTAHFAAQAWASFLDDFTNYINPGTIRCSALSNAIPFGLPASLLSRAWTVVINFFANYIIPSAISFSSKVLAFADESGTHLLIATLAAFVGWDGSSLLLYEIRRYFNLTGTRCKNQAYVCFNVFVTVYCGVQWLRFVDQLMANDGLMSQYPHAMLCIGLGAMAASGLTCVCIKELREPIRSHGISSARMPAGLYQGFVCIFLGAFMLKVLTRAGSFWRIVVWHQEINFIAPSAIWKREVYFKSQRDVAQASIPAEARYKDTK
ncbi:unnamed protein product [Zymoseptoria tritici ST99CH_1A5]|uniref:Uncharacterized protein n=1 Tax=Zymoseptoria tritici ST99CH_1A5 TaxID=1276529 RepID=A0A1Y6LXC8_ZYMTR|nr:unnamed protein product [Zymoseptoria tritici ST99CH_3D1]SMY28078.1 unnamed protein product [Zymoseptoria tritici ST99CH_1A5]